MNNILRLHFYTITRKNWIAILLTAIGVVAFLLLLNMNFIDAKGNATLESLKVHSFVYQCIFVTIIIQLYSYYLIVMEARESSAFIGRKTLEIMPIRRSFILMKSYLPLIYLGIASALIMAICAQIKMVSTFDQTLVFLMFHSVFINSLGTVALGLLLLRFAPFFRDSKITLVVVVMIIKTIIGKFLPDQQSVAGSIDFSTWDFAQDFKYQLSILLVNFSLIGLDVLLYTKFQDWGRFNFTFNRNFTGTYITNRFPMLRLFFSMHWIELLIIAVAVPSICLYTLSSFVEIPYRLERSLSIGLVTSTSFLSIIYIAVISYSRTRVRNYFGANTLATMPVSKVWIGLLRYALPLTYLTYTMAVLFWVLHSSGLGGWQNYVDQSWILYFGATLLMLSVLTNLAGFFAKIKWFATPIVAILWFFSTVVIISLKVSLSPRIPSSATELALYATGLTLLLFVLELFAFNRWKEFK